MMPCLHFIHEHGARTGELDTLFLAFLLACIHSLLAAFENKKGGSLILSGAALGLAAMTKNPLLCVIPAAGILVYLLISGHYKTFRIRTWILCFILPFLCAAAPWYGYRIMREGSGFLTPFFLNQVTERVIANPFQRESFYYLKIIMRGFFPWSFIAVPAILAALAGFLKSRKAPQALPLIMAVIVIAGFSLSDLKFSWYIFPAYPFLAILTAALITGSGTFRPRASLPLLMGAAVLIPLFGLPMARYNPNLFPAGNSPLRLAFLPSDLFPAGWILLTVLAAVAMILGYRAAIRTGGWGRRLRMISITGLILFSLWQTAYPLRFAAYRSAEADFSDRITRLSGGQAAAAGIHDPIRFSLIL